MPFHTTEQEIAEMVEDILGTNLITGVNIPRGKKTSRPFGYLFIDFKDPDVAQDFVDEVDGMIFEDRVLNGNIKDRNTPPSQASLEKKMFVLDRSIYLNNLDYSLNEEEIYNMCEDILGYDLVNRIKIAYDKRTGRLASVTWNLGIQRRLKGALIELDGLEVLDRPMQVTRLTMPSKAKETIEERNERKEAEREAQRKERYDKINKDDTKFYSPSTMLGKGEDGANEKEGVYNGEDIHNQKNKSMKDIFADVMMDLPVEENESGMIESTEEVADVEEFDLFITNGDPLRG